MADSVTASPWLSAYRYFTGRAPEIHYIRDAHRLYSIDNG